MEVISRVSIFISIFFVSFFFAFRVATPVVIDTGYLFDTMFLTQLGWRGVNGLSPSIDYPHFYGGFTAANLTLAFQVFGASIKSVDFAFAMIFVEAVFLLVLLSWKRLSSRSIWLLVVISSAVILGPISLEDGYQPVVNHSFVYNHFALIAILAVSVFAINSRSGFVSLDVLSSWIAGAVLLGLALVKATFILVAPIIMVVCLIQKDFRAVSLMVLGFLSALIVFDPWLLRFSGSLSELLAMGLIERAGGWLGRIHHVFLTIKAHFGPLLVLTYFVWVFGKSNWRSSVIAIGTMLLCAAGYGAATLSMSAKPDLMMVPMIVTLLVVLSERLSKKCNRSGRFAYISAAAIATLFVLPATYYAGNTWLRMNEAQASQIFTEGPLADYAVLEPEKALFIPSLGDGEERLRLAVSETASRLQSGEQSLTRDAYVVLADGVHLLGQIPDIASYGIITRGSYFDFTFPLQSKPVPSFPIWPLQRSTSFLDMSEVDIVMSVKLYKSNNYLSPSATEIVAKVFRPCRESNVLHAIFATLEFSH